MDGLGISNLLYDEDVLPAITWLIDGAEQYLILVSPYNDYSIHLKDAVRRAAERSVKVIAVYRKDQGKKEQKHIKWLESLGASVYPAERLHAKIYANEDQVLMTSMNLLKSSATDSKEVAILISDFGLHDQFLEYIEGRLIMGPVAGTPTQPAPKATTEGATKVTTKVATQGYCVRCQKSISFNLKRPLCADCYPKWAKYKNLDYPEEFCLSCGQKRKNISYAKPRCRRCWHEQEKA